MTALRLLPLLLLALLFTIPTPGQPADQHVLLITIDGFPASLLHDPQAPIPTLRKLAAGGVMGEGMRPVNPSVTWPNHTTLITGVYPAKHSVLFNGMLIPGEPGQIARVNDDVTRQELIATETLFDALHKAGLRTAAINWPGTRGDTAIDDNFPARPENIIHATPRLIEALKQKNILPQPTIRAFRAMSIPARDHVWTEAAAHVIRTQRPHFMAFHLITTDSIHHKYGPKTLASYTALAQADTHIATLLRALDDAGIREKTTLFLLSDHGFASAEKLIQPNLALKKAGLLKADLLRIVSAKVHAIPEGGTAMIYSTDPATREQDLAAAKKIFSELEGVEQVIDGPRLLELGYPDPGKNPQMAHLVLSAKPGYAFTGTTLGDDAILPIRYNIHNLGYHGHLSTNRQMLTAFVATGHRIRKGAQQPVFDNIHIAPTIAHLFNLQLPRADGSALTNLVE